MPEWNVYSSSYIYTAQASLKGVRAVFIRIGGIYPIWSKHASTCRTQASTYMKRADTISDTDSRIISVKSVFNFGIWSISVLILGQLEFIYAKYVFNSESGSTWI